MEAEGFTVNVEEWWHFDAAEWRSYAIGNLPFEAIPRQDRP
jgi:D-alanyl-D-alanine dipeptidase